MLLYRIVRFFSTAISVGTKTPDRFYKLIQIAVSIFTILLQKLFYTAAAAVITQELNLSAGINLSCSDSGR
jgi:hypothetical protein